MKTIVLAAAVATICMANNSRAETRIERTCRNYVGADCREMAPLCGQGDGDGISTTEDRACGAAGFLRCWPEGRRGEKLDACIDDYADKHEHLGAR